MDQHACMFIDGWMEADEDSEQWPNPKANSNLPKPREAYSKRATLVAELRSLISRSLALSDAYIRPPTDNAQTSAKSFINCLPDGCLSVRIALSLNGEINFFFGQGDDLFQILIDHSGLLSYHAIWSAEELGDSDIPFDQFPYFKLLSFVDRNK